MSGSRYHSAFKVADDDHEGRVKLWDDGADDPAIDLLLGTSPNYRTLHVRLGDETPVYEVRDLASYDVRPDAASWADKELLDVPEELLLSFVIDNASGRFELIREEGVWRVSAPEAARGRELDQDAVDRLAGSAAAVRLADPVGPLGEDSPGQDASATVTLRWRSVEDAEEELVYWIGGKVAEDETQRYVARSGFDFKGTVWESSVLPMIEKGLDDLAGADGPGDS